MTVVILHEGTVQCYPQICYYSEASHIWDNMEMKNGLTWEKNLSSRKVFFFF